MESIIKSGKDSNQKFLSKSRRPVTFRDLEELEARCKHLEEALTKSEEKFNDLADSIPQTIVELDLDGNLTYSNKYGFQSSGYDPDDLKKGLNVLTLYVPENRLRVKENIDKILTGEKILGQEYTALRKDGSTYPVQAFSSPIVADHKIIGLRSIVVDITKHKQSEETIKQSEEKYRALFDQKLDGVIIIDETIKILLANKAAAEIFGFNSVEELYQITLLDYIDPEERDQFYLLVIKDIFDNNFQGVSEIRCRTRSGDEIWIGLVSSRIDYQGKIAGLASFRNITNQKRAEEELKRSREELHNLYTHSHMVREEERNGIAHEIHDELGQTLTALKMDLFWLLKRLPKEQQLINKAKDMSKLISESILTVQKISSQLRPAILDDLGLVAAIEWQVGEFQKHAGIKCGFKYDIEDFPTTRECSTAIFRIVQETLTNIIRHAKATKVNLRLSKKEGNLFLQIKDNGKGISQEQISSPYSYGLLGMKERARAFGGEFVIEGTPGKGTLVTLSVPLNRNGEILNEKDPGC